MAFLQDCMFTYLVTGSPEKASKFYEEYVEIFGEPRAQEALERVQAADYVEMRLCKHEDPLLANIANT